MVGMASGSPSVVVGDWIIYGKTVRVIEEEPVLDLIARLLDWASPYRDSAEANPEVVADREAAIALLRACGRQAYMGRWR
jgi:hypothetical protein